MLEDYTCQCDLDFPNDKRSIKEGHEELCRRKRAKRLTEDDREMTSWGRSHHLGSYLLSHSTNQGSDSTLLIPFIGRDASVYCLAHCSRSNYGAIASLNRDFRSVITGGELYRMRRSLGKIEHWVYFACDPIKWEAYDPFRGRWMRLPPMTSNGCFLSGDKESLAVGTELLVFGKEIFSHVIYKYSLLTNSWSSGTRMNAPRCLFGSASLGHLAIVAGGCGSSGRVLSSAELYNSETGTWEILPSMKKARKMCSAVFMDNKFYVIGGSNSELLTCGEVYDLETKTWNEIPNMFPGKNNLERTEIGAPSPTGAPPLLAVLGNELYSADYGENVVRKYDKERNFWATVGGLPEKANSVNGWGLAFRACGDQLIVIGGPRSLGRGFIEISSWVPKQGPSRWDLLARKDSGSFVYNCAVMGC